MLPLIAEVVDPFFFSLLLFISQILPLANFQGPVVRGIPSQHNLKLTPCRPIRFNFRSDWASEPSWFRTTDTLPWTIDPQRPPPHPTLAPRLQQAFGLKPSPAARDVMVGVAISIAYIGYTYLWCSSHCLPTISVAVASLPGCFAYWVVMMIDEWGGEWDRRTGFVGWSGYVFGRRWRLRSWSK